MREKFDVIVLGLGGMGSAVACHVASRGRRVLGLEQFTSPHDRGSSHGESRVIRQAYYENPAYVPLLIRACELWKKLEQDTGSQLLDLCGGLMMGRPSSEVVTGSQRSAIEHRLPVELLDAKQIQQRFPAAGFSGHGFKFCSVVGEILADLSERGDTSFDLRPFRLTRFTAPSPPKLGE